MYIILKTPLQRVTRRLWVGGGEVGAELGIVKKIKEHERRFKEVQGHWAISSDFGRTYLL